MKRQPQDSGSSSRKSAKPLSCSIDSRRFINTPRDFCGAKPTVPNYGSICSNMADDTHIKIGNEMLTFLENLDALIRQDKAFDSGISIFDTFTVSRREKMSQVERIQIPRTPELDNLLTMNAKLWNLANWLVRGRYFSRFDPNSLDIQEQRQKFIDAYHKKIQKQSKKYNSPYLFSSRASMESQWQKTIKQSIKRANQFSGKQGYKNVQLINYNELWSLMKSTRLYQLLSRQTAQQTLRTLISNWHGYFEAKQKWRSNSSKFPKGRSPRPPGYQSKGGHYTATFTNQQCYIRDGFLYFPIIMDKKPQLSTLEEQRAWDKAQTQGFDSLTENERYAYDLITYDTRGSYKRDSNGKPVHYFPPLKISPRMAKIGTFKQVRIVPRGSRYICEIVYEKPINPDPNLDKTHILGIDIGQKNLISAITNIGLLPILIRGSPIVSVNSFFNKRLAELRSKRDLAISDADGSHYTERIERIALRRYNKIYDYFHKASSYIVKYCQDKHIGTIIIGYNEKWKTGRKVSRRFRNNFYPIPFYTLLKMIKYKARLAGIEFIKTNESYTSQTCAFCGTRNKTSRVERGLYVCKRCKHFKRPKAIHSDVNGAINIVKKVVPYAFDEILANDPKRLLLAPRVRPLSSWYGQNGVRHRKMYTPAVC